MKLLHLADIHIGMENYGKIDPATGMHSRLTDYLDRLDEALEIGLNAGVDLVLLAGDVYKSRTPNPTHQREFAKRVMRVVRSGTPVFILVGNHDVPAATGRAHSVEIFDALDVEGVTIADRLKVHQVQTRSGPLQIVAVPWISRHAILTKDDVRNLPLGEIDAEIVRRIENWLGHLELDPDIPAVVAFHGSLAGAAYGAERSVLLGSDLVLPPSVLAVQGVSYIALGHIHRHQVVGHHPPAVYPGSIERIDFSEEHEQKGVVLVDVEAGRPAEWRFVPVKPRPFITLDVDVRSTADPPGRIAEAIRKKKMEDAVVRMRIALLPEQRPLLSEEQIQELLREAGAFFVAGVSMEVEQVARGRYAAVASELQRGISPRRALQLYLESRNTPQERTQRLLSAADALLRSEPAGEG